MRIAVAGFMHESNTFNPMAADRAAFEAQSLNFGPAVVDEWRDAHHEMGGFIEGVEQHGAELLPIVMAWATPSGPVRQDVFEEIVGHLIAKLQELRPDGLLLALHGAMVCDAYPDGDGEVLARLRAALPSPPGGRGVGGEGAALGPDFPIVLTLDLHGNLSQRLIDLSTAAIAYRTCPHVDQRARGLEAASLLVRTLRGEIRPRQALAKPPVIVNIMAHDTSLPPLCTILEEARRLEQEPGILSVSVLPGFAYADVPQMGPSIIVITDDTVRAATVRERENARGATPLPHGRGSDTAHRLGQMLWDMRDELVRPLPGPKEAVAQAISSSKRPVVLVDTGDNVGGGSAGDGTILLSELLEQDARDSVVCLYAPNEAIQCLMAGIGGRVRLSVGGKVDKLHGEPVELRGTVRRVTDGSYIETSPRHGGRRLNHMGITALVELPGRNWLVLNSERHPPFSLGQLTSMGIQPEKQRILVVKAAIAYKAAYQPIAGTIIEVDTPGLTAVNPRRFEYRNIRRLYPLHPASECASGV
ncbi:MAG: M81 family metallopeptidase [Gemmataceae bacterium]|nr:M81 family metallopeptidase [Gemmataceae bacterium]